MIKLSALGLDIGRKRIGVAGCDGLGLFATGLMTLRRKSFQEDVRRFQEIVTEREVTVLVVGLPYSMSGDIGYQAKQVQKYARRLSSALNLSLEFMDERLTSVAAQELMKADKISVSQNKALIDRKAAAIILQQWLDARRG
ncbi:Holliday junction resolvase RuvX [Spirulina sp. CS-785/01]|uniref:Holliday junction resolvase RuvX n=1 Tax=Spirulina sp. CS-785/01 TaxID=3021716 RepID=UPI0023306F8A|nr:Holliday junction resolvase RuvX [Spirulina sp. CS-785/01]MDB9311625.1 Holliday junction resolvase RuvX [Spirulina sp. CS-785/01]